MAEMNLSFTLLLSESRNRHFFYSIEMGSQTYPCLVSIAKEADSVRYKACDVDIPENQKHASERILSFESALHYMAISHRSLMDALKK